MPIGITGNPGVGKHTVAEEIAKKLDLPIIDINVIAKEAGLFEKNNETNDVDTIKLGEILKQKIPKKCLIVGHLAPYVLDKDQVKKMVVFRRNPYDLISVYKKRNYSEEKIRENTGSEVLGIIAHDTMNKFQEKTCQLDTSNKTIQEVVERVISENNDSDEVDWLDLVTKNNDLKKFLLID